MISEESSDGNTTINIYMPDGASAAQISDEEGAQASAAEVGENSSSGSVSTSVDHLTGDRSGVSAVIESIFGTYQPRTQTVTVTAADGGVTTATQLVPGVAGMDMVWIAGVISFLVLLSGFISILRVVIRHD